VTEQEWLSRENPKQLIKLMAGRGGQRKSFLFAAACCRRIWHHLDEERSRRAVEMLERHADGDEVDLASARKLTEEAMKSAPGYGKFAPWEALRKGESHVRAQEASVWAARVPAVQVSRTGVNGDRKTFEAERRAQCQLLRDIFGSPFRPTDLAPAWATPTVVSLARAAYHEPILPPRPSGRCPPGRAG
jgi:hypothetical protein